MKKTFRDASEAGRKGKRMAARKPAKAGNAAGHEGVQDLLTRRISAIAGGLLICLVMVWFVWLVVHQINPSVVTIQFPFTNQAQPTVQPTVDPLLAAGITLSTPAQGQTAQLTQSQALLLANQMEPQAAAHAGSVSAQFVLVSYKGNTTTTGEVSGAPVWLIHYSNVSGVAPDTAADPHATNTSHDCYLFLNASSGQELLALWA